MVAAMLTAAGGTVVPFGDRLAMAADEPQSGGTLTIVRATDPLNLHPGVNAGLADIATNFLLYDSLVIKDFAGKVQPALAESWQPSADGKTWTFKLRKDIKFHSGEPFNSAHVVDHINRWKKMPTSAKLALLQSVDAPDDYTVVFTLTQPTLVFLNNISQTEWAYSSIPNMKKVAELGDNYGVTEVDGTGPFKLKDWVKDDHITLERNPDYKLGTPVYENAGPAYPDTVILQVVPEDTSRTALMETAEADLNIEVAPRDFKSISELDGIQVKSFPRLSSNHIGFNMKKLLFQDINLRQAIQHAIRRDEITKYVMYGQADPAEGYLHPEVPGALPREQTKLLIAYDPDKAKQLLEKSGWVKGSGDIREKNGQKLSFTTYCNTEQDESICQAVQAQLREIGIDMKVKRLDPAGYDAATKAGEHDARFTPMIYTTADHMYFFVTKYIPSPNNIFYSDPKFDDMFNKSQTTIDEKERDKIFGEMERYLLEQSPVVPIQHVKWIFAWQDRVKGTKFHNIHGIYKLMDTWVES